MLDLPVMLVVADLRLNTERKYDSSSSLERQLRQTDIYVYAVSCIGSQKTHQAEWKHMRVGLEEV